MEGSELIGMWLPGAEHSHCHRTISPGSRTADTNYRTLCGRVIRRPLWPAAPEAELTFSSYSAQELQELKKTALATTRGVAVSMASFLANPGCSGPNSRHVVGLSGNEGGPWRWIDVLMREKY